MEDAASVFEDSEKTFIELSNSQRLQIINALKNFEYELDFNCKASGDNHARGS